MEYFVRYLKDIEGRIDPNPYHPLRINTIQKLKSSQYDLVPLSQVVRFKRQITESSAQDERYIGLENVESDTGIVIQSSEEKESFGAAFRFTVGDVLFPRLRPYLNKVCLTEFNGVCSTEFHVLQAVKCKAEYLFAYLNSKLVVNQTSCLMTGNTLPRLQTDDIEKILVPIPPPEIQDKISSIIKSAYQLKKQKEAEAQKLLKSTDEYVLGELGIISPELEKGICYLIESKVIKNRIDPEHYIPVYTEITNSIEKGKYPLRRINEVAERIVRGFEPQAGKEYDYIQLGCIDRLLGRITQTLKIMMPNIPARAQQVVKHNEILFSTSLPQMGAHALVGKEHDNSVVSSGFTIIRATNCNADYLLAILRLKLFLNLCQKYLTGAGLFKTISNDDLFNLRVPHPPIGVQENIVSIVKRRTQKAETLQQEAAAELVKAKVEVEHLISGT